MSQPRAYRYTADCAGGGYQSEAPAYAAFVATFAGACDLSFDPQNYPGAAYNSYSAGCPGNIQPAVPVFWYSRELWNWKIDNVTHSGFGGSCGGTPATTKRGAVRRERGFSCPQGYQTFSQDVCYRPLAVRDYLKYIGPGCEREGQCRTNNPINVGAANKFTMESDFSGAGPGALAFNRYYNSLPYAGTATNLYRDTGFVNLSGGFGGYAGLFSEPSQQSSGFEALGLGAIGVGWRHTFQRAILLETSALLTTAFVVRHDGRVLSFTKSAGQWFAPADVSYQLVETTDGGGVQTGWRLTLDDRTVETYDLAGRLTVLQSPTGTQQILAYDSCGRLGTVSNAFGHTLTFGYSGTCAFFVPYRIASISVDGAATFTYQYDVQGRLVSVTAPDQTIRQYLYENAAFKIALTGILDESGQRFATVTYDSEGRPTLSEHAGGAEQATVTYTYAGLAVSSATLSLGGGTPVTYNFTVKQGVPRVSSQSVYCRGCPVNAKTITYDANGNVTIRKDFNNVETRYSYDLARNLETSRTEAYLTANARTITTQWHATFRLPTLITESGRTTAFTYDTNGNQLTKTITDTATSATRTWTNTYDSFGRMLTANGPRTDVTDLTTYAYYSCTTGYQCGQLQTITDAAFHVTTFNTYNVYGQPLTITDPNSVVTTLAYDTRHRLSSRTVGFETTTFDYWPTGLLKKVTLPDSSYLLYTYDAAHRLTRIDDATGNYVVYTLDAMGNRIAENVYDPTSYLTRTHSRVFNSLNQLWKDLTAAGTTAQTTVFGYDSNGNQTTINAPLTRISTNAYDALNRLKQVTDPASGITQFGYDATDNLTSVTDPRTKVTNYTYTGFGDLKTQTSPDTGLTTNTYDSGGNLKTSTDARNAITTYTLDALNRVTSEEFKIGSTTDQTISFGYDVGANGSGRLTSASDANHSMSWSYDVQGRVTSKGQTIGTVIQTVGYGYTNGNWTSMTTPSGQSVVYGYNSNHQVTSVSVNGTTVLSSVLYDPFGPARSWSWGNATLAVRTYDTDGKITQVDSAGLKTYAYDDAFRITGITDTVTPANSYGYGFDSLDRLTSAVKTGTTRGWTYDANGNRLTETGASASTYTIASTNNRISSIAGALPRAYSYDTAGNVLTYATVTATYNNHGRMKTLTNGAVTANYVYNALGQFVKQSGGPSGTVLYVYDEAGHLLGEYNSTGGLIQETIWMGDTPVATIRPGAPALIYYVHTDHLDTPRRVTRPSDNKLMWTWYSDAFGSDLPNENPAASGTFKYNLRFPGQLYDSHAGLNQNWHRDYEPATGRYYQFDPLGLKAGINGYVYVDNNPLIYADPLGLQGEPGSGTTGCSYYQERCKQRGGAYYCRMAPFVCENTPDSKWTRCVRKCLQDADRGFCAPDDSKKCKGSDPICIINIHQICWQECLREEGPPSSFP